MGKRAYFADVAAMALLYRKQYLGIDIILYDTVVEYDAIINDNLDAMRATCGIRFRDPMYEYKSELYFYAKNENFQPCLVIDPNANIEKAWSEYVEILPIEVVIAAQQENALNIIGLRKENGKIVSNKTNNKILIKK